MDNENLNNNEELENVPAEPEAETVIETMDEETTETVVEETAEIEEAEADVPENDYENVEAAETDISVVSEKKGLKITAYVAGVIVILAAVAAGLLYTGIVNPYEKGYIDISGKTLEDVADSSGYSLREYKKLNGLPWLMPKSTNENAAKNSATIKATLAQSGTDFSELKEYYGWDDSITEDTTVGKALGATKLSVILGVKDMDDDTANQTLDALKEFYGFGDEVTLDTLYGDVREKIDEKTRETRLEQEKEETEESDEDGTEVTTKDADTQNDDDGESGTDGEKTE